MPLLKSPRPGLPSSKTSSRAGGLPCRLRAHTLPALREGKETLNEITSPTFTPPYHPEPRSASEEIPLGRARPGAARRTIRVGGRGVRLLQLPLRLGQHRPGQRAVPDAEGDCG